MKHLPGRRTNLPRGPVVVYVCGYGRSGSTALGRYVARSSGLTFVGEAAHSRRFDLASRRCTCGHPGEECGVWSVLGSQVTAPGRVSIWPGLLEGPLALVLPQRIIQSLVLRLPFGNAAPGLSYCAGWRRIANAAGGFVDSSKTTWPTAARPLTLAACGFRVVLIEPRRSLREIVRSRIEASRRKRSRVGHWSSGIVLFRTLVSVAMTRILTRVAKARMGSASVVIPFDVLQRPDALEQVATRLPSFVPLLTSPPASVEHALAGNRSRWSKLERHYGDDEVPA